MWGGSCSRIHLTRHTRWTGVVHMQGSSNVSGSSSSAKQNRHMPACPALCEPLPLSCPLLQGPLLLHSLTASGAAGVVTRPTLPLLPTEAERSDPSGGGRRGTVGGGGGELPLAGVSCASVRGPAEGRRGEV